MNLSRSMLQKLGLSAAGCSFPPGGCSRNGSSMQHKQCSCRRTHPGSVVACQKPRCQGRSWDGTEGEAQGIAQKVAEAPSLSPYERFKMAPPVARVLGLAGAIPFIALAPPVCKHLTSVLPAEVVDNCAMLQVGYGVCIVTFLGAVHWGVAASSLTTGPIAARIATEGYIYSVLPCLAAWPVTAMEPGAGSVVLSMLLPICLLADYSRRNMGFPIWYIPLRVPLTTLATFGMLLTATRHVHEQLDRAKAVTASEAAAAAAAEAPAAAK